MRNLQLGMDWFPESPGGLSRYYYDLYHALGREGVDVRGVVVGSGRVAAETHGRITAFAEAPSPLRDRLLASRREIKRVNAAFQPDMVAAHFALYALPSLDILRRQPLVMHFHGPWAAEAAAEGSGRFEVQAKRMLEGAVYRRASRFIVLSRAFANLLSQTYAIPESRIEVVPGGADTGRFSVNASREEARKSLGWPTDRPIILTLRRLVNRMGLERLVAAMTRIRNAYPDALLLIGGRGILSARLTAMVEELGLSQNVRLIGHAPDASVPLLYRAANVSVVPSVALEGFGLITTESLASGTPVMVTPVGGLPEAVADLSPDLVLSDSSEEAIADGLIQFLGGHLRIPDAADCSAYARSRFDWTAVAPKIIKAYAAA